MSVFPMVVVSRITVLDLGTCKGSSFSVLSGLSVILLEECFFAGTGGVWFNGHLREGGDVRKAWCLTEEVS